MDESASSHVSSLSAERAWAAIPTTDAGASQLLLDPDAASELIRNAYLPVRVLPQRTGTEFRMQMTNLQMGTMTAGVIAVASSTRIVAVETTHFHLDLTLRGRVATGRSGAQPVVTERGAGVLFNPEQIPDILWSDNTDQMCLKVPRETLESEIEALLGRVVKTPSPSPHTWSSTAR